MIHMTDHAQWFDRLTGGASGRSAALKAGLPPATLNRQLSRGQLSAEFVIALCRAYNTHPVAGQVATGYLTPEEGNTLPTTEAARLMSDQDLIRELAYRVDSNPASWTGTFDEVVDMADAEDARIVDFPDSGATPDDFRIIHDEAVADSSPDHDEEDTDFD